MNREKIFDKVKTAILTTLDVEESVIKEETKIVTDLGADSIDEVELVIELEKNFDVNISDAEAEKFETVRDIVDYLEAIQ